MKDIRTPSINSLFLAVLFSLFICFTLGYGYEDLKIVLDLPSASALGSYSGMVRIALGEVKDEGVAESNIYLGEGPQAMYSIEIMPSRVDSVKNGLQHLLKEIGMLSDSPQDATYTLNITILRDRFTTHQTAGRFRLRAEVFLECSFMQTGTVKGTVLVCGNAETHAQVASKKKIEETYQAGFNDALYKLINSKTFTLLIGEGWKAAQRPAKTSEYDITRIEKEKFYGPSDIIVTEVPKAAAGFQAIIPIHSIILQDFEIKETEKTDKEIKNPESARGFIPALIKEHLQSFYPGAFASIERRKEWGQKEGVVVTGELLRFKVGSFMKRALIGFGAGKDKLEATIVFKNGKSGSDLHSYYFISSNWGAAWQMKGGQIRDMADQLARDIAYFLVKSAVPNYKPSEDLEICFDDTPYPPLSYKQDE